MGLLPPGGAGLQKLPFELGLVFEGWGKPAERSFVYRVLVCSWFWLVFIVGGCKVARGLVFLPFRCYRSFALFLVAVEEVIGRGFI